MFERWKLARQQMRLARTIRKQILADDSDWTAKLNYGGDDHITEDYTFKSEKLDVSFSFIKVLVSNDDTEYRFEIAKPTRLSVSGKAAAYLYRSMQSMVGSTPPLMLRHIFSKITGEIVATYEVDKNVDILTLRRMSKHCKGEVFILMFQHVDSYNTSGKPTRVSFTNVDDAARFKMMHCNIISKF